MSFRIHATLWLAAALMGGCAASSPDPTTLTGKQQIIDDVDVLLTNQLCDAAIAEIQPLYNSTLSDNLVRMHMASAFACDANINLFQLLGDMVSNASSINPSSGGGASPFTLFTKLFPSTAGADYVVEGALFATDALQSVLNPGALVLPIYQVNPRTYAYGRTDFPNWNVGSVFPADRVADANLYMIFVEMAALGGIQNRFGAPDSTGKKTKSLAWNTAVLVDANGAAYASSLMNFMDALDGVGSAAPASVSTLFSDIATTYTPFLDQACEQGCVGGRPGISLLDPTDSWTDTGCALPAGTCTPCPVSLRDRTRATGVATDATSCAAAGLVNFMNVNPLGFP